jgi:phage shock protein C
MEKRLHRSLTDKKIAGVCGGLAEYLGWDATLVRLLWVVLTLLGGSGVLIYIVLWIVMPEGA